MTTLIAATVSHFQVSQRDGIEVVVGKGYESKPQATQLDEFGDVRLALAAYNAGPERARKGLRRVPLETSIYISRVLRFEREYEDLGLF